MGEKITIEIPEWAKERRFIIYVGREVYMLREPDGTWYKKVVRCNYCGKCCLNPGPNWPLGEKEIEGKIYCGALDKQGDKYLCCAGSKIPITCLQDAYNRKAHPDCSIEFEEYYKEKGE